MKKLLLLLSLAVSGTIFSQATSSPLSDKQKDEIYKGLQQNKIMKEIIRKQDDQILKAQKLIESKDSSIEKCQEASRMKDKLIQNKDFQCSQENEIRDAEIKRQTELREMDQKFYKRESRKKFWKGFSIGGVTVGIIGTGTAIYFLTK